ncbi:MAG: ATP-binding protein [Acidimicrobiia bacterium]|nr:ATP-binding protein [Acidimicrobiia bacterium]
MTDSTSAKIAFVGSHSVRKTNAVHSFAGAVGRSGRSVEVGREVVRFNPLGLNEGATPGAQLWVLMSQIQQELELRNRTEVLVTDRAVVDNYAYYLRVTGGEDPFDVAPLVRNWSTTYDLHVRLLADVPMIYDGVRSTSDAFRDEIESILDRILPQFVPVEKTLRIPASQVTESFDWAALVERLVGPPDPHRMNEAPARYARLNPRPHWSDL